MNNEKKSQIPMKIYGTEKEEKEAVEKSVKELIEVCANNGVSFSGIILTMTGKETDKNERVIDVKCSPFFMIPRADMQIFVFSNLYKLSKKMIKKIQKTDFKSMFTS